MSRALLGWTVIAALAAVCAGSVQAQGLGSRMGTRVARGGRMAAGRQASSPAGANAQYVASQPAAQVAQGGAGAASGGGTLGSTQTGGPLFDVRSAADLPNLANTALNGQVNGVNFGNGMLTLGDGQNPGTAVLLQGRLFRRYQAQGEIAALRRGQMQANAAGYLNGPWHHGYYETSWGRPVPLVVPPTAWRQTDYGWGIANTRVTAINPQFTGPYPGYSYDPAQGSEERWRPTPYWPSDTTQFGVNYIRGPW